MIRSVRPILLRKFPDSTNTTSSSSYRWSGSSGSNHATVRYSSSTNATAALLMTGGILVLVWKNTDNPNNNSNSPKDINNRSFHCFHSTHSTSSSHHGSGNVRQQRDMKVFLRPISTAFASFSTTTTKCDEDNDNGEILGREEPEEEINDGSGYSESERFYYALQYYSQLLPEYERLWVSINTADGRMSNRNDNNDNSNHHHHHQPGSEPSWPRNIPKSNQIPALVIDLEFCRNSRTYDDNPRRCQDQQFKVASFYIFQHDPSDNEDASTTIDEQKKKGYRMIKELAENGHPDGMCLLGT